MSGNDAVQVKGGIMDILQLIFMILAVIIGVVLILGLIGIVTMYVVAIRLLVDLQKNK